MSKMTELASGAITAVDTVAIELGEAVETPAIIHTSPRRIQGPQPSPWPMFLLSAAPFGGTVLCFCMVLPPIFDVFCRSPSAPGGVVVLRASSSPARVRAAPGPPVDDHQTCRHDARHDAK
jgi:hypothetical protein